MPKYRDISEIIPPPALIRKFSELAARKKDEEIAEESVAAMERYLRPFPDTFVFYERGASDLFILHVPFASRMRHSFHIMFDDLEEAVRCVLPECLFLHLRLPL